MMDDVLINPVYNALISGDASRSAGIGKVRFFDERVSPFAGFEENYAPGFEQLSDLLPPDRKILYAAPVLIKIYKGWKISIHVPGLQFALDNYKVQQPHAREAVLLTQENVEEMLKLTALTKPGPFDTRTIEFGHYYGIFENNQLVAMTGQRLHVYNYTEVSAVCTHPDYLGKGFAGILLHHQINLIIQQGQIPFLHVRADNARAIDLYKRIGFQMTRPMNFYFMKNMLTGIK